MATTNPTAPLPAALHPFGPVSAGTVFRIDAFVLPDAARDAFFARAGATQALLRRQRGLVRELAFERIDGSGRFNLVTLAAWSDAAAIADAAAAVAAESRASGFYRAAFLAAHGIAAEMATFRAVTI